ncbi:GNAT family N-acetyltransferase [Anoxybacillus ayderensis]|uniref:GNAT family N-acetyltransferase n=1 Tax=Anoxybacillus ayderensis TaxID=265546 RepID=UPI000A26F4B6|nr:GNAT family N-acetyltransferase [Anoxybacillus ayderensis]MED0658279.1 GNAT family N-acetyltransferase [Anoxybacillus ayderensis]OSX53787.1 GNAT family N-acetyltransferase [Anoxybacillus ayderensis]
MNIRHATVDDAERLAALILQVESESDYLLFEAGERKLTPEQQRSHLEAITNEDNATILLAETDEGELVGYLLARGGFARRNRHSIYIVIGLLAAFRGKGMGTMLLTELERWAREKGVHRLELTVVVDNAPAICLYKKMGFEQEGIKRHSLNINGRYVDEYYMAKLLS